MSDRMDIQSGEAGLVRVFALDLPAESAATFRDSDAFREALGAAEFDPAKAEVIALADLEGLGLSGYLVEGQGVAPGELDGDRARLDGLSGHVVVIPSSAFRGAAQTVQPRAPLRHLGTYAEARSKPVVTGITSEAAKGNLSGVAAPPAPTPGGSRGRLIAVLAAMLIVALLLGLAFTGGNG